jgi:hypothetical protein
MRNKQNPDLLARVLASAGQFWGKARLADLLGRLTSYESRDVIDSLFNEILCVPSERLEESMAAIPKMRPKH